VCLAAADGRGVLARRRWCCWCWRGLSWAWLSCSSCSDDVTQSLTGAAQEQNHFRVLLSGCTERPNQAGMRCWVGMLLCVRVSTCSFLYRGGFF
jgi:hypothetical protein